LDVNLEFISPVKRLFISIRKTFIITLWIFLISVWQTISTAYLVSFLTCVRWFGITVSLKFICSVNLLFILRERKAFVISLILLTSLRQTVYITSRKWLLICKWWTFLDVYLEFISPVKRLFIEWTSDITWSFFSRWHICLPDTFQ